MNTETTSGANIVVEASHFERKAALTIVLSILAFLLAVYFKFNSMIVVLGALGGLLIAFWIAFSLRNTLILLFLYIMALPVASWGKRYDLFQGVYFNIYLAWALAGVIILWLLIEDYVGKERPHFPVSSFELTMVGFLVLAFLAALRGGFENGNLQIISVEVLTLFFYASFFLYLRCLSPKDLQVCWLAFLVFCVVIALEFTYLTFSVEDVKNFMVRRVVTQQPNLAQLGLPLMASLIFMPKSGRERLIALVAFMAVIPMVFFSQQRGLWGGVVVSLLMLSTLVFFRSGFSLSRMVKFVLLLLSVSGVVVAMLFILDSVTEGSVVLTVLSRIGSVLAISIDESTAIRLSEIKRALAQWSQSPINMLFGTGLGASYFSTKASRSFTYSVDNSFVFILWKMGMVGLLVYLALLFQFYKKAFFVLFHAAEIRYRQVSAALLAGFSGLLLIALTNACLTSYRFVIFWALSFATVELMFRELRGDSTRGNLIA